MTQTLLTWLRMHTAVSMRRVRFFIYFLLIGSAIVVQASEGGEAAASHGAYTTLLWIAVILVSAKLSSLIERYGQPSVLGELIVGVILGNLGLVGLHAFDGIRSDTYIPFLAELGVIILLFQVGLESNLQHMRKVGMRAFLVATVGVVVPFLGGLYLGPMLLPGLTQNGYLFLGAALTATSVGITARVFKDLGKLKTPEAQIVLGAAVIDDVMGLIILAIVSALVTLGTVSTGAVVSIIGKALIFLVGSVALGQMVAPYLGRLFSKIHTGIGMKFTLAIGFALIYSYVASVIGLAPIVGAFAAGLVLDPVHFRHFKRPKIVEELEEEAGKLDGDVRQRVSTLTEHHSHKHVEDLVEPVALFFVPIFFVVTGMNVRLETLFDPQILLVALGITVVAFLGKYVAGIVAGKVNKHVVGFGMVPRGEVGLIFATIGRSLGVINDEVFSVIVIMVIFTTLLTPPILTMLLKRQRS